MRIYIHIFYGLASTSLNELDLMWHVQNVSQRDTHLKFLYALHGTYTAQRVPLKSLRIYYFQSLKRAEHGEKKVIFV